jgi:hypothetical protein
MDKGGQFPVVQDPWQGLFTRLWDQDLHASIKSASA